MDHGYDKIPCSGKQAVGILMYRMCVCICKLVWERCCTLLTAYKADFWHSQRERHTDTIVKTSNNEICHCKSANIYYFTIKDIYLYLCELVRVFVCYRETRDGRLFISIHSWHDNTATISYKFRSFLLDSQHTNISGFILTAERMDEHSHRRYASLFTNLSEYK